MTDKVFFSEAAIRANELAARRAFMPEKPNPGPEVACYARLGKDLAPLYIRKILEEVNRDTPAPVVHVAVRRVIGWILASSVASVEDPVERMLALRDAIVAISDIAGDMAMARKIVEVPPEAAGQAVGGNG